MPSAEKYETSAERGKICNECRAEEDMLVLVLPLIGLRRSMSYWLEVSEANGRAFKGQTQLIENCSMKNSSVRFRHVYKNAYE